MAQEATYHNDRTSKHSRPHNRHRHGREAYNYSGGDESSISNTKGRGSDEMSQDPVPGIFIWSEPVLDAQSSGRFQYQARLTPAGYQWTISGSESGTNPQYLSPTSAPKMFHPLDTTVTTYPSGSYVVHHPIQSKPQYYGSSNTFASPAVPPNNEGIRDYVSEKYYEEAKPRDDSSEPRRGESSNGYRDERKGEHHHRHRRSHSHHRSRSHGGSNSHHQRHTGRGHGHANPYEKASGWLHSYEYAN